MNRVFKSALRILLSKWRIVAVIIPIYLFIYVLSAKGQLAATNSDAATDATPQPKRYRPNKNGSESFFHLLVPATRREKNLCRLLLSSTALGYPTPVFINWGKKEDANRYKEHLAKVSGILRYLSRFSSVHDNDLALVVDGFDLWFQLRPEVMIKRYYSVIKDSNQRLAQQLDKPIPFHTSVNGKKKVIKNSLVFGPDKICWPEDASRTACWAVPNSTLNEWAFGPQTDSGRFREHYRPRWLNSGTIMGPIADIRRLMQATHERIQKAAEKDVISDQYHMANLWGEQEYARRLVGGHEPPKAREKCWVHDGWKGEGHFELMNLKKPKVRDPNRIPDYHITIDYESQLFQTMSYYRRYLGWVRYDGSTQAGRLPSASHAAETTSWYLPDDILSSQKPFPRLEPHTSFTSPSVTLPWQGRQHERRSASHDAQPENLPLPMHDQVSWKDLALGTNAVTKQVFGILHFTPPKGVRDRWWNRMWYFPYGAALMRHAAQIPKGPYITTADKRTWTNYEIDDLEGLPVEHRSGGMFADSGSWNSWHEVCSRYENEIFYNP